MTVGNTIGESAEANLVYMELSVYKKFLIEDEYQIRKGDYIVTYGIFQEK